MGTVGLSFGSPTSGAGFDVSSTVAEIVGNLQNVETPWKNQLTALESQDAAISNLGTLYSNLSNDIGQLTDFTGTMAQKTGSSSDTNVLELTAATSSALAGTHTVVVNNLAQTSSGYLAPIASATDKLSGSITLQVGSGTAQTIDVPTTTGENTIAGLAAAINASGVGVSASVLTDASGSRLSLVSGTSGAEGNIAISANSLAAAASTTLNYTGTAGASGTYSSGALSPVGGLSDLLTGSIQIQVGGSGTPQTINLGAGETLQQLADAINNPSTGVTGVTASVITNSDGSSSLSLTSQSLGSAGALTVTSNVTDASTFLGYTNPVSGENASLTVDGANLTSASNTVTNLIPGLTFQLLAPSPKESDGSLEQVQVVIGNDNSGVESAVNQFVTDYNSLISAINTQDGNTSSGTPEPLFGSPTLTLLQQQLLTGLNLQNPNGNLDPVSTDTNATISGSISIQVGDGTAENIVLGAAPSTPAANTIYAGSGVNSLSGLAQAINSANIGVTAEVATSNGQSTLSLLSQTSGSAGALTVNSEIVATGYTPLSYSGTAGTSTVTSTGTLTSIASGSDLLTGSISIQVGSGTAKTVVVPTTNNTLQGLADAINGTSGIGVTASVVASGNGTSSLSLLSQTPGAAGTLNVSSSIMDTTNLTASNLDYTNSSDISTLASLGITISDKDDGSLDYDANTLDAVLNSDYNGVIGFFQSANSWGQTFANMLNSAGTSSSTGILALASSSNSSIESTLNAEISKEQSYISAQQSSLTTELNQANEIMQELPTQLNGMNELYSAITGYDENLSG